MFSNKRNTHIKEGASAAHDLMETEAAGSSFVSRVIPGRIVDGYLEDRAAEAAEYERSGSDHSYLIRRYFRLI